MNGNDLYPTPTRLDLLRAVRAGQVFRTAQGELRRYFDDGTYTTGRLRARLSELEREDWVRLNPAVLDTQPWHGWCKFETRPDGDAVLAAHDPEPDQTRGTGPTVGREASA